MTASAGSLGLAPIPLVGAAEARRKAQDYRRKLAEGIDPSVTAKRRTATSEAARSLTLGQAIDDAPVPAFKNNRSFEIRDCALRVHFKPLHGRNVASITAADVAGVLRTLKPQTAIKSHAAIRSVFDFAIATLEPHGVRFNNPADKRLLRHLGWSPKSAKASTPHPSLDWRRMPEFMAELARHDDIDARCLALTILTAVRAGSARLAKWKNFDLERGLWSIPIPDLKDLQKSNSAFHRSSITGGGRAYQDLAEARRIPVSQRSQSSDR